MLYVLAQYLSVLWCTVLPVMQHLHSIIKKHQWARSTSSHTCPCHNSASTMFNRWFGMIMIPSFPSPYSSPYPAFISSWSFGLICQKTLVSKLARLFRTFLAKSNQAFCPWGKFSVFTFIHLHPRECSWFKKMLWMGFFFPPMKEFDIHPLLLSFVAFGVAELTTAFLLLKNVPDCWCGHSKNFCYLSDRSVFRKGLTFLKTTDRFPHVPRNSDNTQIQNCESTAELLTL